MTTAVLCVLLVVTALYAWQMRERASRPASDLEKENASLRDLLDRAHEALRDLREQQTEKHIRMTNEELSGLAKTGCTECHGAGYRKRDEVSAVCPCVIKRMRGDPKYGMTPDGDPVRLATRDEVLAFNALSKGGAQC